MAVDLDAVGQRRDRGPDDVEDLLAGRQQVGPVPGENHLTGDDRDDEPAFVDREPETVGDTGLLRRFQDLLADLVQVVRLLPGVLLHALLPGPVGTGDRVPERLVVRGVGVAGDAGAQVQR